MKKRTLALVIMTLLVVSILPLSTARDNPRISNDKNIRSTRDTQKIQGTLQVDIYDDFDNHKSWTEYSITDTAGNTYKIDSKNVNFEAGDTISVEGSVSSGEITASKISLINSSNQRSISTGQRNVALILVNSIDNPIQPISTREAWNKVFSPSTKYSLNSYMYETSEGKLKINGKVFGWYTVNLSESDLCNGAWQKGYKAADNDIDYRQFDTLIVAFPRTNCPWGGLAQPAPSRTNTSEGWIYLYRASINGMDMLDNGAVSHEFGHILQLRHANDLECDTTTLGKPCSTIEYGDQFDIMGLASSPYNGHFNSINMEKLNWLNNDNIAVTSNSQSIKIYPIEIPSKKVKFVKVPINSNYSYYLEFRRPIGYDIDGYNFGMNIYNKDIYDGVMIRMNKVISPNSFGQNSAANSQLLDMTPKSNPASSPEYWVQLHDSLDVVLREGNTFTDQVNGIQITTIDVTEEYVEVSITKI